MPATSEPEDRQALETLFLDNLETVERITRALCGRSGLAGDDADDFESFVKERLIEHDYAVLGKFRGGSALRTYLTSVIINFLREYRDSQWGRWRPSAAAKREGAVAVQLERRVYRDGESWDQAVESIRASGQTEATHGELRKMVARLRPKASSRPVQVGSEPLDATAGSSTADDRVLAQEAAGERSNAEAALNRALDQLPTEERQIVRMHFEEGLSVADTARALALEQKPLYRRIERILRELRKYLEDAGVSHETIRELLADQETS